MACLSASATASSGSRWRSSKSGLVSRTRCSASSAVHRRAGTVASTDPRYDPGSAAHHAARAALRRIRGTRRNYAFSVSRNRTGSPVDGATSSPLPHHSPPAHKSSDRPARHFHAIVRRPARARSNPFVGDGLAALEIDDRQIGIVARGDPAFARDVEQPRQVPRWLRSPWMLLSSVRSGPRARCAQRTYFCATRFRRFYLEPIPPLTLGNRPWELLLGIWEHPNVPRGWSTPSPAAGPDYRASGPAVRRPPALGRRSPPTRAIHGSESALARPPAGGPRGRPSATVPVGTAEARRE